MADDVTHGAAKGRGTTGRKKQRLLTDHLLKTHTGQVIGGSALQMLTSHRVKRGEGVDEPEPRLLGNAVSKLARTGWKSW
jgi:hypothetical protein